MSDQRGQGRWWVETQPREPGTPHLAAHLGFPYLGLTSLYLLCRLVPSCQPSVPPGLYHTCLAVLSVSPNWPTARGM